MDFWIIHAANASNKSLVRNWQSTAQEWERLGRTASATRTWQAVLIAQSSVCFRGNFVHPSVWGEYYWQRLQRMVCHIYCMKEWTCLSVFLFQFVGVWDEVWSKILRNLTWILRSLLERWVHPWGRTVTYEQFYFVGYVYKENASTLWAYKSTYYLHTLLVIQMGFRSPNQHRSSQIWRWLNVRVRVAHT